MILRVVIKILCVAFVVLSVFPDIRAEYGGLYPKELVKIPYSHFIKSGIDYFYVSQDSLYIFDYRNLKIREFSISKGTLIEEHKPELLGYTREPKFVVSGDDILILIGVRLYQYNKKSKTTKVFFIKLTKANIT